MRGIELTIREMHFISLRWGRTTGIGVYCDTGLLKEMLHCNAVSGVAASLAAPIPG
jgi:hypothetical protein